MNIRSFAVLATLCLGLAARSAWPAGQTLEMQVGESRVLAESGVTRVAIGDSQVLSAIATDSREVVVFARTEGVSSIQVWADGGVQAYDVHVAAAGVTRLRRGRCLAGTHPGGPQLPGRWPCRRRGG